MKNTHITPANSTQLKTMAQIVAQNPLFAQYGLSEEGAFNLLKKNFKNKNAGFFVATQNKSILGFAWVEETGAFARSPYLRLIALAPPAQGKGVGAILMQHIERIYLHKQKKGFFLLTTSTNRTARRFYESLGYKKIGLIRDYVHCGLHECIYFKSK